MKRMLLSLFAAVIAVNAFAQLTKTDVFDADVPVTFLGLDFTQAKFIGNASQFGEAGEVSNNGMKEKYMPAWNDMFSDPKEKKNFKIAEAVNRMDVDYATDVAGKANKALKGDFFSDKMSDYPELSESRITSLVKKYDFMGKNGLGLIFFVEGMRKGEEKGDPSYATVWVTFVDMKSKSMLFTTKVQAKAGGFGFRNFWAGAWKNVIKEMDDSWKSWKKG